ncbi:MAG: hypothetical protein EOP10_32440, partial [Proteobacteria bacterium]
MSSVQPLVSGPVSLSSAKMSFYAKPDESQREALLSEYLAFLLERNGSLSPEAGFSKRDEWLSTSQN